MSRLRIFFLLAAATALAVAFAACGGSSDSGSSDVPPQKVLDQTFSGNNTIESGTVDASIKVEASGDQSGSFDIGVSGPFDSNGSGTPKFDMTAKLTGDAAGQNLDFEAGVISTGDAAYVSYQGTDYALSAQQYATVTKALKQSSTQNQNQDQGSLPGFKDSFTDLTNEGEADVDGTNTTHVSGSIDPAKLGDAVKSAIDQGAAGGVPPAQLQQLQAAIPQLDQVTSSIKEASFDVYSGVDDHLLRKLDFNLDFSPSSGGGVKITFDLTLGEVNEPQTVSAPSNSEPIDNLLKQVAPLLGGLGAVGGTNSAGGSTSAPPAPVGADAAMLECLQSATTAAEVQACAAQ